jgi:hypothetical protein
MIISCYTLNAVCNTLVSMNIVKLILHCPRLRDAVYASFMDSWTCILTSSLTTCSPAAWSAMICLF